MNAILVKAWADTLTATVLLALAAFVWIAGRRRHPANVRLALVGALYGANLAGGAFRLFGVALDERWSYNLALWAGATLGALAPAYLLFVGVAVHSPIARPFGTRAGQRVLAALTALAFVAPFAFAHQLYPGPPIVASDGSIAWLSHPAYGLPRLVAPLAVALVALAASLDAWRRAARGSIARTKARHYALAFGLNDLAAFVFLPIALLAPRTALFDAAYVAADAAAFVSAFLLARALLRYQLFDLDLRVKWTLRRGTLVAIFVCAFVLVEQLIGAFANAAWGVGGGIAVAILLAFAFRPLERIADRFADAALPNVTGSPEYIAQRKLQVYRAMLEGAREDGKITEKERAMLDKLARELDVKPEDARAVEAELVSRG